MSDANYVIVMQNGVAARVWGPFDTYAQTERAMDKLQGEFPQCDLTPRALWDAFDPKDVQTLQRSRSFTSGSPLVQ